MARRLLSLIRQQGGSAFLFTTASLVFILTMGGFATDFAYQVTAKNELQRAMDAAALAGAGKLNFDDQGVTDARNAAQQFAVLNPYRNGTIGLDLNVSNDPSGHIVLGTWDPSNRSFSPAPAPVNPVVVNSVMTQFSTTIPTSFLRLLGFNTLPVQARAIAWAPPPATPPTTLTQNCVFPVGVIEAPCGSAVQMISSSQSSSIGANTAAWVNMTACSPANPQDTAEAIENAGNDSCPQSSLRTGMYLGASGGELTPAFQAFEAAFPPRFAASPTVTIKDQAGQTVYTGQAWAVTVPVLRATGTSQCPFPPPVASVPGFLTRFACAVGDPFAWLRPGAALAQQVNQNHEIVGFSKFYMVQGVFQKKCVIRPDNPNYQNLPMPSGGTTTCARVEGRIDNVTPTIYGFLNCEKLQSEGQTPPDVGPSVAFADTLKLVR